MDKYSVSIIVPVYNVERYIAKTIDSIIAQERDDIQVVLVNDGSQDDSREIVAQYISMNSNMILIDQENQGLGAARNTGMRYAEGRYILFVDSDDYLEPKSIGKFVELADLNELDMLQLANIQVDESGNILRDISNPKSNGVMSGSKWLSSGNADPASCFHLYRREFLERHNLRFMEGVYHEDMDFTMHALYFANRVMSIDDKYYYYLMRENSITAEKSQRRIEDYYAVASHVSAWIKEDVDGNTYELFFKEYLAFLFSHVVNMCIISNIPLRDFLVTRGYLPQIVSHLRKSNNKIYRVESLILRFRLFRLYKILYCISKAK